MQSYNSPDACVQTGERVQVWDKDATLDYFKTTSTSNAA